MGEGHQGGWATGSAQQFGEFQGPESQGELRIDFSQPEKPGKEEVGTKMGPDGE